MLVVVIMGTGCCCCCFLGLSSSVYAVIASKSPVGDTNVRTSIFKYSQGVHFGFVAILLMFIAISCWIQNSFLFYWVRFGQNNNYWQLFNTCPASSLVTNHLWQVMERHKILYHPLLGIEGDCSDCGLRSKTFFFTFCYL